MQLYPIHLHNIVLMVVRSLDYVPAKETYHPPFGHKCQSI